MSNFGSAFAQGLGSGMELGTALREKRLAKTLAEEPKGASFIDAVEPGDVPHYELGGKRFYSEPAPYLVEAHTMKQRAEAYRAARRFDRADVLDEAAEQRMKLGKKERAAELSARVQPIIFNELGEERPVESLRPEEQQVLIDTLNDPVFDELRNTKKAEIRVRGLTPVGDGRAAIDVDVVDPKTGKAIRQGPITDGRSQDPNDSVTLATLGDYYKGMQTHLRGLDPEYAALDNAARETRGKESLYGGLAAGGGAQGGAGLAGQKGHGGLSLTPPPTKQGQALDAAIQTTVDQLKLPPEGEAALRALASIESSWGANTTGQPVGADGDPKQRGKRAMGPFQFMPSTWAQYGQGDPNDPRAATDAAGRMLLDAYRRYGDWEKAALAHHQGMGYGGTVGPGQPNGQAYQAKLRTLLSPHGTYQSASPAVSPSGLSSAVRLGARGELTPAQVEQYGATGRLAPTTFVQGGDGVRMGMNPYTGAPESSYEAPLSGRELMSLDQQAQAAQASGAAAQLEQGNKDRDFGLRAAAEQRQQLAAQQATEKERMDAIQRENDYAVELAKTIAPDASPEELPSIIAKVQATNMTLGWDRGTPNLQAGMHHAKANSESMEAGDKSYLFGLFGGNDTKFVSYAAGAAAARMGFREDDRTEMERTLMVPLQSLQKEFEQSGQPMTEEDAMSALTVMGTAQEPRYKYTPAEARALAAVTTAWGMPPERFAELLEVETTGKRKLTPQSLTEMLNALYKEQTQD